MIEIIKASQVKGSRKLLGEIYASAFKNDLIYFSIDEEKTIKAFKYMFNLKF